MNSLKVKILDYLGQTWWIHLWTVILLSAWLIFFIGYSTEQYITWMWQAPIVALYFNITLSFLIRWFVPKWRKRIGYKTAKCEVCGK